MKFFSNKKFLFSVILELMNCEIEVEPEDERIRPNKSEVQRLYVSNEKIISLTKWHPKYGGLDGFKKGLEITIDWFKDPNNLKLYGTNYVV